MLSMKLIGNTPEELKKAKTLYYRAFPKNERRSFPELVENRFGVPPVLPFPYLFCAVFAGCSFCLFCSSLLRLRVEQNASFAKLSNNI